MRKTDDSQKQHHAQRKQHTPTLEILGDQSESEDNLHSGKKKCETNIMESRYSRYPVPTRDAAIKIAIKNISKPDATPPNLFNIRGKSERTPG